jgi:AraC-like DNA-binding protein
MEKNEILRSDLLYAWSTTSDEMLPIAHRMHDEYELVYFIQGDVLRQVGEYRFVMEPDSLLLIPPHHYHNVTVKSARLHQVISIHFSPELLEETERDLLKEILYTNRFYYPGLAMSLIGPLFQSVMDCKKMEGSVQRAALKHSTLSLLFHIHQFYMKKESGAVDRRIEKLLDYLNANPLTSLSVKQLARNFGVSKDHLNTLFRKQTGTTVYQYLRGKRLYLARQEIRNGLAAEEAAYKIGFADYSNFYRAYKSFFGVKPSDKTAAETGQRELVRV